MPAQSQDPLEVTPSRELGEGTTGLVATEAMVSEDASNDPPILKINAGDAHVDEEPEEETNRRLSMSSLSHGNSTANIAILKASFEKLLQLKDILKKHQDIVVKATTAAELLKRNEMPSEVIIFEPLRMVCELKTSTQAKILALDCLSKIFTFNIFNEPTYIEYKRTAPRINLETSEENEDTDSESSKVLLIEAAILAVNSTFEGEGTDPQLELQIIKVLTGAIINESMPVHGKILMPAIRQIYSIFLMSLSPSNQAVAQATLIQVVGSIYEKVNKLKESKALESTDLSGDATISSNTELNTNSAAKALTLAQIEDSVQDKVQLTNEEIFGDEDKLYVKDAVLVIRTMNKLAIKPIDVDNVDMRSQDMRSKLLALHIIHWILLNFSHLFVNRLDLVFNLTSQEETSLIEGVKKGLCLTLSRNAASQNPSIYEVTLEIYYLMISKLRSEFKYEIPVFLKEIYFPISEMKTSTAFQKRYILDIIRRLSQDSSLLIELYLNYDCDTLLTNFCEDIVNYLTNYSLSRAEVTSAQELNYKHFSKVPVSIFDMTNIPELNVSKLPSQPSNPDLQINFPIEYGLKMLSIECIVAFLKSLDNATGNPMMMNTQSKTEHLDGLKSVSLMARGSVLSMNANSDAASSNVSAEHSNEDELSAAINKIENSKQKKTALLEGTKLFNFSPKKGLLLLEKGGFLVRSDPESVAKFLLENDNLDKKQIGEYLGGGKEENIAAMHAFVDLMNFHDMNLLTALRAFLQHFRLPGESQVIDRYMLKFAEKYLNDNPDTFEEADTAYVLSYSIIMLNTDQHSEQVKKRMTFDEFVRNNRAIDNGKDVDSKLLEYIFNDIRENEIVLKDEQDAALISSEVNGPIINLFGAKNANREAYSKVSQALSSKTEQTFTSLQQPSKSATFHSSIDASTTIELVKSMFDTLWMSLLAGLTPPFKDYDDEVVASTLLEGILVSIHISSLYDLDFARTSFVRALVQFCNIDNPEGMRSKNILAISALLDVASFNNDHMKSSWKDIFVVISQIERLKLLAKGVDSNSVPDLMNARFKKSMEVSRANETSSWGFFNQKKPTASEQAFQHYKNQKLPSQMVAQINSTELDVKIDKVFSRSSEIQGDGIIDFVNGLVDVSQDEINSSIGSNEPRLFSLQKLVDVCYYNMGRIRVQWSGLWNILNEEFNKFGCSKNQKVAIFALDSLRQLAERFFNIEELAHFKFQREFLKPFDYSMQNNDDLEVKEMILNCVQYLIVKKEKQIKSGWSTLLEILASVGRNTTSEKFVLEGFKLVEKIIDDKMESIINEDAIESLVLCLSEFAMNDKFQKINLRALNTINKLVDKVGASVDNKDGFLTKMWLPLLKCYDAVIENATDLEVRSQALNNLFDALAQHGGHFDTEFWQIVAEQLLFPIFEKLETSTEGEEYWVWLSTTLLQALKKMIMLFTNFFDDLKSQLDGYLNLLMVCTLHTKDPISQSGLLSVKEFLLHNVSKFEPEHWDKIENMFDELFKRSAPTELFDLRLLEQAEKLRGIKHGTSMPSNEDEDNEIDEENTDDAQSNFVPSNLASVIVNKCRHQYYVIELVYDLFESSEFYFAIPVKNILQIASTVNESYLFAKKFNENSKLRMRVWNAGLVENLPNLRKQETQAVLLYVKILFNLYCDGDKVDDVERASIANTTMDLIASIFGEITALTENEDVRRGWLPVFGQLLQVMTLFKDDDFALACPRVYNDVVSLLLFSLAGDVRQAVINFFQRVGAAYVSSEHVTGTTPNTAA